MRLQEWLAPRLQRPEAANDARILQHCCHLLSNIFPVLAVKLGSDGVMLCAQDETGAPYVTVHPRTPAVQSDVQVGSSIMLTGLVGSACWYIAATFQRPRRPIASSRSPARATPSRQRLHSHSSRYAVPRRSTM